MGVVAVVDAVAAVDVAVVVVVLIIVIAIVIVNGIVIATTIAIAIATSITIPPNNAKHLFFLTLLLMTINRLTKLLIHRHHITPISHPHRSINPTARILPEPATTDPLLDVLDGDGAPLLRVLLVVLFLEGVEWTRSRRVLDALQALVGGAAANADGLLCDGFGVDAAGFLQAGCH